MWPFFGLNVSLRSIAWSHGFQICSESFFKNTLRNLWYSFGTSSSGVFSVSFSYCVSSTHIVSWTWYWRSYSSFSGEARNANVGWSIWQCHGQCVIFTVPLIQSISGLWCLSQENSRTNVFFPRSVTSAVRFSWCPWNLTMSSTAWVILPVEFHILSMLYTGMGFCKGISGTLCFSAQVLSIKIVFAPESRSMSNFIKSFQRLAGVIWIDRHISCVGKMLHMNMSSGISSLFLLFFVEELSLGLMSPVSLLWWQGRILLSMESLLSSISFMDRTLYTYYCP